MRAVLLDDADPVVRGAAVWALARLDPVRWAAEWATRAAGEEDETVREEWTAPAPARSATLVSAL